MGIIYLLREGHHTSHKASLQTNNQANKAIPEADQARRSSYHLADHTEDGETWGKHTHTYTHTPTHTMEMELANPDHRKLQDK